jgi:hypothetical protein
VSTNAAPWRSRGVSEPSAYLFLSGKDKEAIAAELKAAFKLPDTQAVKIVRRITGRARFFQRVDELMTAK